MKINFEELFEERILERGFDYYLEDFVHDVTKEHNYYEGLVYGTEIYEVRIKIDDDGNVRNMDCNCPYARESNCKHMAALLYHLENDGQTKNKEDANIYNKILEKLSENEIKKFVLEKLYKNPSFQNEFRSCFAQYFEKTTKKEYENRISRSIYEIMGQKDFIEYNETYKLSNLMYHYFQEASNFTRRKEYQAPFWIISSILEKLSSIYIDDSDGTIVDIESECIEFLEIILEECEDQNLKIEIFNWIIESLKKEILLDYTGGIENILENYFFEEKYVNERLKIIDGKIQKLNQHQNYSSKYEVERLLRTKILLLYELGKDKEALEIIKDNIYYVSIRKMLIDIEKEQGNIIEVERLLKDGMEIALNQNHYGTVENYIEELLSIYEKQNEKEKYKKLVEETLFKYSRGSFNYYKKLKNLYTQEEWKTKRDSVIKELESGRTLYYSDELRKIYIEEQYYDKLYNAVINVWSFEIMLKNEKYLKKDFEEQLLEKYKQLADERAKFVNKRNYVEVREILQHMKTLKNGEQLVEKMVEEYKIKYARRRTMLEELDKI